MIAFNTRPEDSADAAARWLSPDWAAKDRGEYRQAAGAIGQVLSGGAVTNGPEAYPQHQPQTQEHHNRDCKNPDRSCDGEDVHGVRLIAINYFNTKPINSLPEFRENPSSSRLGGEQTERQSSVSSRQRRQRRLSDRRCPCAPNNPPHREHEPLRLMLGVGQDMLGWRSVTNGQGRTPLHPRRRHFLVAPLALYSLGAVGGLVSSAGIVSREWAAIQSTASFSKANFPK